MKNHFKIYEKVCGDLKPSGNGWFMTYCPYPDHEDKKRSFAVREWLRTGNIYNVKEQLGHSSVTVTEGYTVHKRSKISDDHPSLKGKVQDQPKKLDLGDSDIVSVTLDEWGLS